MKGVRTISDLQLPKQELDIEAAKAEHPHLRDINAESYDLGAPKLLIGLPYAYLLQSIESRVGKFRDPMADKTRLGWVIYGANAKDETKQNFVLQISETPSEEGKTIKDMMRSYFSTEEFGVKVPQKELISKENEKALEIMERTGSE